MRIIINHNMSNYVSLFLFKSIIIITFLLFFYSNINAGENFFKSGKDKFIFFNLIEKNEHYFKLDLQYISSLASQGATHFNGCMINSNNDWDKCLNIMISNKNKHRKTKDTNIAKEFFPKENLESNIYIMGVGTYYYWALDNNAFNDSELNPFLELDKTFSNYYKEILKERINHENIINEILNNPGLMSFL